MRDGWIKMVGETRVLFLSFLLGHLTRRFAFFSLSLFFFLFLLFSSSSRYLDRGFDSKLLFYLLIWIKVTDTLISTLNSYVLSGNVESMDCFFAAQSGQME